MVKDVLTSRKLKRVSARPILLFDPLRRDLPWTPLLHWLPR